jgi:tRNA(Ile)-lysidine synthase
VEALGYFFVARVLKEAPERRWAAYCTPGRQVFDADTLGDAIVIRTRRDGDVFRPFGMRGEKKLLDYFVDIGVPAPLRDRVPVIEAGGRIVWIAGHATSGETAVTAATRRIVEIEVNPCV